MCLKLLIGLAKEPTEKKRVCLFLEYKEKYASEQTTGKKDVMCS